MNFAPKLLLRCFLGYMKVKFLIAYLISLFFFSLTYSSSHEEFAPIDLIMIFGVFTCIFLIQCLMTLLVKRWKIVSNLSIAFFIFLNIVSLNLILNEDIAGLSTLTKLGVFCIGIFILYTLTSILDENPKIAKYAALLGVSAIIYNFGSTLIESREHESFSIKSTGTSSDNIKTLEFIDKPNIYIVLFDSLIPKSIMKKHFGVPNAAYHHVLDEHFFKFNNFFVEKIPTKGSLNRLLALDSGYYKSLQKTEEKFNFKIFPGIAPSPLFQVFKHNGYETSTIFNSRYFGKIKGPFIDNYLANQDVGACEFIEPKLKKFTFFGICNLGRKYQEVTPVDFLISSISDGLKRNKPQILVSYIFSPGHATKSYDHANLEKRNAYAERYFENSKVTADSLNKIISFLKQNDPTAILYLSGDHGPYLSRKVKYEDDPKFFIQDKFAVFGGIFPKESCIESFSKPYTKKFMTTSQGTHMIIRCLTGGDDAFVELDEYFLPKKTSQGWDQYENYLYE